MGKVLALGTNRLKTNNRIGQKAKKNSLFNLALSELKQESGIDYYKLLNGDQKEQKKFQFRQYQDSLVD
jgi:predicted transcriptional regulator with HTH domain